MTTDIKDVRKHDYKLPPGPPDNWGKLIELDYNIKIKQSTWGEDTSTERAENERWRKWRENAIANAPYIGWPKLTPMFTHHNPKVNEIAKLLWELGI